MIRQPRWVNWFSTVSLLITLAICVWRLSAGEGAVWAVVGTVAAVGFTLHFLRLRGR